MSTFKKNFFLFIFYLILHLNCKNSLVFLNIPKVKILVLLPVPWQGLTELNSIMYQYVRI